MNSPEDVQTPFDPSERAKAVFDPRSGQPQILMCPPDYYGIEYEINPWMSRSRASDRDVAVSQWTALADILRGLRRGIFEIHFPKRFTRTLKLLQMLPYRWYFAIVRKATGT